MARVDQPPTVMAEGDSSESSGAVLAHGSAERLASGTRASDKYAGTVVDGRYYVERIIGEGGMGVVYAARHQAIGKRVALKILRVDMAGDREIVERFTNEARAASAVGSPHIVDVTDFGRLPDGAAYFVMEYVEGSSLGDEIARLGALPLARVVALGKQIAKGLQAAHDSGVVHRDLKPDNIMLAVGHGHDFVKILDFGIAKLAKAGSKLTKAGAVFGTPHYMAPEQAAGNPVDHRADIYALGIILYELCAGHVPFDGENFLSVLSQHMHRPPSRLVSVVPNFPSNLDAVISKCLAKSTEQRYGSMTELLRDLERIDAGAVPEAETSQVSGYFRTPPDYFPSQPRIPIRVATPATFSVTNNHVAPRPWPFAIAGFVAVLSLACVVALSMKRTQPILPGATSLAKVSAGVVRGAELSFGHAVQVRVVPPDAVVQRGDARLESQPIVDVPAGQEVILSVNAPGFAGTKVVLDAATSDVLYVRLNRGAGAARAPSSEAARHPPPRLPQGLSSAAPATRPRCSADEAFLFGKCTKL